MDIGALLRSCDGLAPARRLVELGASRNAIAWAAGQGVIRRVRKGWYCLPETPLPMQEAARVGGRLTEVSAAVVSGVWAPPHRSLHVALPPNACRPRERDHYRVRLTPQSTLPVTLHWTDVGPGGSPFVVGAIDWMRELALARPIPVTAAVADSALRTGALDFRAWAHLRQGLPAGLRNALAVVDGIPESGTESIVRAALTLAGIPVRPQVWLTDSIRVDLLVGERLVVELHSQAHHGSREQRVHDLERTAVLVRLGYEVLVFDYAQVMAALDEVIATISAAVANLRHVRLQ